MKIFFTSLRDLVIKKTEIIVIVIFLLVSFIGNNGYDASNQYITGDGVGYYAYLPAIFIYQDLSYSFIKKGKPGVHPDFRRVFDGRIVNMTFAGAAVLWIPFFLIAHGLSHLFGLEADGYSILYQYSIYASALVFLFIGLYYLRKLLKVYKINDYTISITQLFLVFGTPIYFYTSSNPSYTHIYSFSLITVLLVLFTKLKNKLSLLNLVLAGIIYALIILLRPSNGMVILILPFIFGGFKETRNFIINILRNRKWLIILIISFVSVLSIQLILYKIQTDKWLLWTYTVGENKVGFDFSNPHILEILFSYRKGLFVYTPLLLFSLLGFIPFYRENKFKAVYLFFFLLFVTYVLSSWWNWAYGMSMGNRAFIDFFSFFAIILAYCFKFHSQLLKASLIIIFIASLAYNQILDYQQRYYILYWNMNKEMFWRVFLKTDPKYMGMLWDEKNIHRNSSLNLNSIVSVKKYSYSNDFEDSNAHNVTKEYFYSGDYSLKMDANKYGSSIKIGYEDLEVYEDLEIYVECFIYSTKDILETPFSLVFELLEDGKSVDYFQIRNSQLRGFKNNEWNMISFNREINRRITENSTIKVYIWKRGNEIFYVDDVKVIVYPKNRRIDIDA